MELEQSIAEANRIMADAGWKLFPDWDGFTRGTLVAGIQPDGLGAHVKDWARIPPGHPLYSADTPDEPHEAAAWLVRLVENREQGQNDKHVNLHEMRREAHPDALVEGGEATAQLLQGVLGGDHASEPPETQQLANRSEVEGEYEGLQQRAEETGDADAGALQDLWQPDSGDASPGLLESETGGVDVSGLPSVGSLSDRDYDGTFPELDGAEDAEFTALEFGPEMAEAEGQAEPGAAPPQDRFYGLDDLDRRKTVAIGLVMRHAKALRPHWTTDHDAALVELRNFAMGVREGFFADDAGRQAELQSLEAVRRQISAIEAVRDVKIAEIEAADRDAFEAFSVEAGWP